VQMPLMYFLPVLEKEESLEDANKMQRKRSNLSDEDDDDEELND
jgi:hypothetical protein